MLDRPLAIDLFTGLHGWAEGLVMEGFEVVGFDIEDMCTQFDMPRPAHVHLVLQDVLTIHGSQFKDAALIVASPPCQAYSYRAMPWKRAKALGPPDNSLFEACFRIQREAIEAAGRFIPLVVENVRGAIPWVGRSRWNYGSYHLWGDVPALMPIAKALSCSVTDDGRKVASFRFDGSGKSFQSESVKHTAGIKGYSSHGPVLGKNVFRRYGSKSKARKRASALIAKIPLPLSRHIARTWKPV